MQRREFLESLIFFTFQASVGGLVAGCRKDDSVDRPLTAASFPQGVASADPTADSVVLWTRAQPAAAGITTVFLHVEVALDPQFEQLVLQEAVTAQAEQDYTVHVRAAGLGADQICYYRFVTSHGEVSRTGRTRTAPAGDSVTPLSFAFVSCQERKHGFYGAYRRMLQDDLLASPAEQIRFVLHLGDFIYETDETWQDPLDEHLQPIVSGLYDESGQPRNIGRFPDGAVSRTGVYYADTVADYRHLYKVYLQDPDLLEARARWPFVCIWDDHEFSDDCWQSEANYVDKGVGSSTDEPSQRRKVAANQAWSEFIPMDYGAMPEGDSTLHAARPFHFAKVNDVSNAQPNADNRIAIGTMTVYRRLQFGQMLDLVLTDNRSYRSDHAVPEDFSGNLGGFVHPRSVMPLALLNQLDAGETANGGQPPAFVSVAGSVFQNPRRHSLPGSILGEAQKQWWKAVMQHSTARWKVWGNSVPIMRLGIDLNRLDALLPDVVVSSDSWDGYAHERRELMAFLQNESIRNVVSLSGDVHAHFAGHVMADYDVSDSIPVAVEVVTAAISSLSMFAGVERMSRREKPNQLEDAVRGLIAFPDPADPDRLVPNLDNTMLNGVESGLAAARNETLTANPGDSGMNAHLVHAETSAHGYGLVRVTATEMQVKLVSVKSITNRQETDQVERVTRLLIPFTDLATAPTIKRQ